MGRPKLSEETASYAYYNGNGDYVYVWFNEYYYNGSYGRCELRTTKNMRTHRVQYYYTVYFFEGRSRQTMSAKTARRWCDNGREIIPNGKQEI